MAVGGALLALTFGHVEAALVTQTFGGEVAFSELPGLAVGDPVSGTTTFDSALLTGIGPEFIEIDSDPAFHLTVSIGSLTFTETQDVDFGEGFPQLLFVEGDLFGLDFFVLFTLAGQGLEFAVEDDEWVVADNAGREVAGGTFNFFAVPAAAPLLLLGVGLATLGLGGRRRL